MEEEYDEFGNLVSGPQRGSDLHGEPEDDAKSDNNAATFVEQFRDQQIIVLPEHRQLFPTAKETFGSDVEVLVFEEDTLTLEEPVVKPSSKRVFTVSAVNTANSMPDFPYSDEFMRQVLAIPGRHRSIVILGPMHSGKTSFIDMLIEGAVGKTMLCDGKKGTHDRLLDNWIEERDRNVTLFMKPFTLLLKNRSGTSQACTLLDTPGHMDFLVSEQETAMEMADLAVVVVDALEGAVLGVKECLKLCLKHPQKPFLLFINKIDRLILEVKFAPNDCYFKLKHLIDSLNTFMESCGAPDMLMFRPEIGNVVFGSVRHKWCFTSYSFAERILHADHLAHELSIRLFGDIFYNQRDGSFCHGAHSSGLDDESRKRTFVRFVLEPIYKAYTSALSEDPHKALSLSRKDLLLDIKPLIAKSLTRTIGWDYDFMFSFTNTVVDEKSEDTIALSHKGLLFQQEDVGFLVKIASGNLTLGQYLYISTADSSFANDGEGDGLKPFRLTRMFLYQGSHRLIPLKRAIAGNIVYIQSPDLKHIADPLFVLHTSPSSESHKFAIKLLVEALKKKKQLDRPVSVKIGVEPLVPSLLPRMQEAIHRARKCYGRSLEYNVEETGEHCLVGTGELFMDVIMGQLRNVFSLPDPMEIRVSDPSVVFCETVIDSSPVTCYATTPNGRLTASVLAEPLELGLAEAIEDGLLAGKIGPYADPLAMARTSALLMEKYGWDVLAARSVLAVGPDPMYGPNVLLNDMLSGSDGNTEELLNANLEHIVHAFQWTCRQGPLIESPVRGVKFRLVGLCLNGPESGGHNSAQSSQLIPTVRKAFFAAMITATIKLMEPVLRVEVVCPLSCKEPVFAGLAKRRGHVTADQTLPGTPFYSIEALVPAIDAFGLECDIRIACQGMAVLQSRHALWQPVPGDPFESSIKVPPLTAAPAPAMSRDFIQKTRRRKGLAEEIKMDRFLDDKMLKALSALNI